MKTTKLLVALVALLTIGTSNGFAQRGMGRGMGEGYGPNQTEGKASYCHKIPNLTEEQKTQIEALRVKHMKSTTDLKNQMNEKRARLRTLESAENPNYGKINKTMNKIIEIKETFMKIEQHTELRSQNYLQKSKEFTLIAHIEVKGMEKAVATEVTEMAKAVEEAAT